MAMQDFDFDGVVFYEEPVEDFELRIMHEEFMGLMEDEAMERGAPPRIALLSAKSRRLAPTPDDTAGLLAKLLYFSMQESPPLN